MKHGTLVVKSGIVTLLLYSPATCLSAQGPCLTDASGARDQQRFIEAQFDDPDPAWRRELGLPDSIQAVRLVDSNRECAAALAGLRAQGDSLRSSTSSHVYLFRVYPGLYVAAGDADLNAITFLDHRWRYITTLSGVD
jgi:hypothetical protein